MKPSARGWLGVAIVLCAAIVPVGLADTLLVPSQYATIQAAIDAAVEGDEVVIADGVYTGDGNRDLDFGGKAITVRSASDNPELCVIDCEGAGRGFYFGTGELATSLVQGLTIQNGFALDGGGVYCYGASPDLSDCIITGSVASTYGGGLYCENSSPTLVNCAIAAGTSGSKGGGVYCCQASSPALINCTIQGNVTLLAGGGIYCRENSNPNLTDCSVTDNTVTQEAGCLSTGGGGLYCNGSSPALTHCVISGNTGSLGGGIAYFSSEPVLAGCTIARNVASNLGGGVYCSDSTPSISDCLIVENAVVDFWGGGMYCQGSSPTVTGSVISANRAPGNGAGVSLDSSAAVLTECVIADNMGLGEFAMGGGISCGGSDCELTHCNISGNTAGGVYCAGCDATLTDCVISYNNPEGIRCQAASPAFIDCVVTGNRGDGVECLDSSTPTVTNCTIAGNGGGVSCWSDSNPALTNCILWANANYQVYTDSGTPVLSYCDVQGGWPGEGNIDADPGFAFPEDVRLLPGSLCIDAGSDSPPGGLPTYDLDGNPRSMDGDGDGLAAADIGACEFNRTAPTIALSAPLLRLTLLPGETASAELAIRNSGLGTMAWELEADADWLTADPVAGESSGEMDPVTLTIDASALECGVYVAHLSVQSAQACNSPRTLAVLLRVPQTRCVPDQYATIQEAIDAALPGDAVLLADGVYTGDLNKNLALAGKPIITVRSASDNPAACIIDCEGSGQGFFFDSENRDSVVRGITIRNGNADGGGAVQCDTSSPTLINCRLTACTGTTDGGGLYCYSARPLLINCVIDGNVAGQHGGGICCYADSTPTLVNCTITGNTAGALGGGIYSESWPALINCVLWGDTPQEVYGSAEASYCDVQGGRTGTGNINADPLFRDPSAGDFRLSGESPCIDAGDNGAVPADMLDFDHDSDASEPLPLDITRRPRFVDDPLSPDTGGGAAPLVDMGAYEYQLDGDCDLDWSIDLDDFGALADCMRGPAASLDSGCGCADFDGDADIDLADFAVMQSVFSDP